MRCQGYSCTSQRQINKVADRHVLLNRTREAWKRELKKVTKKFIIEDISEPRGSRGELGTIIVLYIGSGIPRGKTLYCSKNNIIVIHGC